MKNWLIALTAGAILAQPAHADICADIAKSLKAKAPHQIAYADWPADEVAIDVTDEKGKPPFSDTQRLRLIQQARDVVTVHGTTTDESDIWLGLLAPDEAMMIPASSQLMEMKSAGLGYLLDVQSGSAHAWTASFYTYDGKGPILTGDASGKGFVDFGSDGESGDLIRFGDDVAWVTTHPESDIPFNTYDVRVWQNGALRPACRIKARYDFHYVADLAANSTPEVRFLAAGMAPWLATYRQFFAVQSDDGRRSLQQAAINNFTTGHPKMAPDLQRIRVDMDPGWSRLDLPVVYDEKPAVVRIQQGAQGGIRSWVDLELWVLKDGAGVRVAEVLADTQTTGVSVEIEHLK